MTAEPLLQPNPSRFYNTTGFTLRNDLKGWMWADSHGARAIVNTVLPPNNPSCRGDGLGSHIINTMGSYHKGGCHVLMCDGAVKFITNNIDAGTPTSSTSCEANGNVGIESPWGIWGAAGSRNGGENRTL